MGDSEDRQEPLETEGVFQVIDGVPGDRRGFLDIDWVPGETIQWL